MPKAPPRRPSHRDARDVSVALSGSIHKVRKRIRDIERLLKRESIPADIRVDKERELKALNVTLDDAAHDQKIKKIAKKYHMVRFFERKKAIRKLKQAVKQYDSAVETEVKKDIKKARKVVKHCQVDVAYVVLFPKDEKYISLYPNSEPQDISNPKVKKGIQQAEERSRSFKKYVESLIDQEKLPFSLDDAVAGKTIYVDEKRNFENQREIDAPEHAQDENEEDDFFE